MFLRLSAVNSLALRSEEGALYVCQCIIFIIVQSKSNKLRLQRERGKKWVCLAYISTAERAIISENCLLLRSGYLKHAVIDIIHSDSGGLINWLLSSSLFCFFVFFVKRFLTASKKNKLNLSIQEFNKKLSVKSHWL